jgi:glycerate-2-kinase
LGAPTSRKKVPRNLREIAAALFHAAVEAVHPGRLVEAVLHSSSNNGFIELETGLRIQLPRPLTIVGAGKAAAAMAAGCESVLGPENVVGEVISTDGTTAALTSVQLHRASHPLPDERGVTATRSVLRRLRQVASGPALCLISGGASSLLVCPRPPLTLADKIETNRLLLQSGVPIDEVNAVRKHLSEAKGGGLLKQTDAKMVTLLISDVVGDDPAVIGSGPTAADPTTFADVWRIIEKYALPERLPAAVRQVLQAGLRGKLPETVKPGSPDSERSTLAVIGSNRIALAGAATAATDRGWEVLLIEEPIAGDTTAAAMAFATQLQHLASQRSSRDRCLLAGGETTVQVRGPGRGGRNQEFALALVNEIAGDSICVLSAGTDGIDGPTDAAGAFVDGTTLATAVAVGLDPQRMLASNDSYTFFEGVGGLFRCGATGTNVTDIKIALIPALQDVA